MIYKTAGASKSLIVVRAADTLHKIQFRFQTLSSEVFGLGERRNISMYVLAYEDVWWGISVSLFFLFASSIIYPLLKACCFLLGYFGDWSPTIVCNLKSKYCS